MPNTALNRTGMLLLTNKTGGDVAQGDVVVISTVDAASFVTTTTAGYALSMIGVVIEPNGIASNAIGLVAFTGYIPKVNLESAADIGDLIKTHTVAKQGTPHAAPSGSGDFGEVLDAGTTPPALLWNNLGGGGGGGGDFLVAQVFS